MKKLFQYFNTKTLNVHQRFQHISLSLSHHCLIDLVWILLSSNSDFEDNVLTGILPFLDFHILFL